MTTSPPRTTASSPAYSDPPAVAGAVRSPLDEADLRGRVQARLADVLDQQGATLQRVGPELTPLLDALRELLHGGKRLRPAFCYWGWRGAGGSGGRGAAERDEAAEAGIVTAASALELLQACALVHDDVMDGSDLRRGLPTAHRRFAAQHRARGWRGASEQFGLGAAILLGDLALSWADEILLGADLPAAALARAKPVYDEMRTELMAGQYLDLLEQVRTEPAAPSPADASPLHRVLKVARYKAAKYTVERPLHLGGALAGAGPEVLACYSAFGLPLGEAFQLRDDVLGVFGDPAVTGKPAGDDLREGKRTALVAVAAQRATPAQAELVDRLLGDPGLDDAGVDELRTVLTDTGAVRAVEDLIAERLDEALSAVQHCSAVDADAAGVLNRLALAATTRAV